MKEGLRTARRLLVAVVVSGVVGLLVCFPHFSDAAALRALRKLDALDPKLDVPALEGMLQGQAERGAAPDLKAIVERVEGPGVQGIRAGEGQPALFEARPESLETMGEIAEHAQGGVELEVFGPDLDRLATSLRWRLGREQGAGELVLTELKLGPGGASEPQLALEREIEPLRLRADQARERFDAAHTRFEQLTDRAKALWKAKAPNKVQWKAYEERRQAQEESGQAKRAMDEALDPYERKAQAALAFAAEGDAGSGPGVEVLATFTTPDGESRQFRLPVPRVAQTLHSVALVLPSELAALQHDPLWSQLQSQSLAQARDSLRSDLSWQALGRDLGPLRMGGATVVQLYPAVLLALLWLVSRQCRAVHAAYSPFNHPGGDLPEHGLGDAKLDAVALNAPGVLVTGVAVWTLARLDAGWWIALLLGVASIAYAALVTRSWESLGALRANIIRTSIPPAP